MADPSHSGASARSPYVAFGDGESKTTLHSKPVGYGAHPMTCLCCCDILSS